MYYVLNDYNVLKLSRMTVFSMRILIKTEKKSGGPTFLSQNGQAFAFERLDGGTISLLLRIFLIDAFHIEFDNILVYES